MYLYVNNNEQTNNMLNNIRRKLLTAMQDSSFFTNIFFGGDVVDLSPYDREGIVKAYAEGLEIRTIIDKVADGFKAVPTKWVDAKTGEDVEGGWRQELLSNPNPLQVQSEFEFDFALQYLLFNECFVNGGEKGVGLQAGKRVFLKMIQGQYVAFKVDKGGNVTKFVNSQYQSENNTMDVDNIQAVIGSVLDPVNTQHATPKLHTAAKLTKKLDEGHVSEANAFKNNGVAGIVSAKSKDSFKKVQSENMQRRLNDSKRTNSLEYTSGEIDYHDISRTPVDLGVLESSKNGQKALALAFNYPLPLISDDASTYNNAVTAEKSAVKNNFIPFKELYCQKINEFLEAEKDGIKLVVDVANIEQLKDKPADLLNAHELARTSVNDRRRVLGLPALEGEEYDLPILRINDQLGYVEDIGPTDLGDE